MADKAVSELIEAEQITATDLFVLEQNGTAKKLTGQILLNWLTAAADGHGGIQSISKMRTEGLADTYRITLADTTTFDFVVTNGRSVNSIIKTSTSGLVDAYTITYNDGTTGTITVTNGAKGDKGDNTYVWIKYASTEPTESSHSFGSLPDDWIGIYFGPLAEAPTNWREYAWYQIKGEKGDTGAPATLVSSSVTYQVGDSGSIIPSGVWSETVAVVPQGKYLWTRVIHQFNTGDPVTSYSVSRMGMDGTGSVSSVAGISPDSDGNVPLTADDVKALPTSGGNMTGAINMNGQALKGLNAPTADDEAANKGYVDNALEEKLSMELLWENASPTSEFAAQIISLPTLSNYKTIAIETARGTFVKNTTLGYLYMSGAVSWSVNDATLTYRTAEITNNGILFMSGYVRTLHDNQMQVSEAEYIPVKIYGVKGVSA